jgi:hypothetical protein
MPSLRRNDNPFALMLDPQSVLDQIERSQRLERLQRRICRPLDRPLLGAPAGDAARFDADVDAATDDDAETPSA